jgi:LysM repeat protein
MTAARTHVIRKALVIALAVGVAAPGPARAGVEKAGTTAANFLSVGSGAGILGMGGAVLGGGTDLNAAAWNAAALGWVGTTEFGLSHAGLPDEQSQEWVGVGGRWRTSGTRWALTGHYHGQGTFEGRDPLGNPTGTFNVSNMALGGIVAQRFGSNLTAGFGAKYVREDLGTTIGQGVTFDGGLQYRTGRYGVGIAGQNVGGRMTFENAYYPFPANYGAGVSVDVPEYGVRVALDANMPRAYYSDVRGGVEWRWRDMFALRSGFRMELGALDGEPLTGPSFGMGAGVAGFWFDYGYLISGPTHDTEHKFGITVRPGAPYGGAFGSGGKSNEPVLPDRAEAPKAKPAAAPPAKTSAPPKAAPATEKAAAAEKQSPPAKAEPQVAQKKEPTHEPAKVPPPAAKSAPVAAATPTSAPAAGAVAGAAGGAAVVKAEPEKSPEVEKAAEPKKRPKEHKVKPGDTIQSIAALYETSVPKIMDLNNMVNTTIHIGQVIKIPPLEKKR